MQEWGRERKGDRKIFCWNEEVFVKPSGKEMEWEMNNTECRTYVEFVRLTPGTIVTTVGYFVVPKRYPNHDELILKALAGRLSWGTKCRFGSLPPCIPTTIPNGCNKKKKKKLITMKTHLEAYCQNSRSLFSLSYRFTYFTVRNVRWFSVGAKYVVRIGTWVV